MTRPDAPATCPFTRRQAVKLLAATGLAVAAGGLGCDILGNGTPKASVFVAKAESYAVDLGDILRRGLAELGVTRQEVAGKRVLLKPNLVEPHAGVGHINTHPLVIRAAGLGRAGGRLVGLLYHEGLRDGPSEHEAARRRRGLMCKMREKYLWGG